VSKTILSDPGLVPISVASEEALRHAEETNKTQGPADAAQDALRSLVSLERSLDTTRTEPGTLGVGAAALDKEIASVRVAIGQPAGTHAVATRTA
jgi:hypothetical protein